MTMKTLKGNSLSEPNNVLFRIKRGLAGYISYLAACEMNESFSEYVLYEPILRILTAQGYIVKCEVPCPGIQQPQHGDRKRLDFTASKDGITFAMEVKWVRDSRPDLDRDLEKLTAYRQHKRTSRAFFCVFGRKSHIADIQLPTDVLKERGDPVFAEFINTRFGCRIYEVVETRGAA
ncbi:MAG: hypothetical protein ACOYYJ_15840 [Chloroflexota bacterium]